jgi:spermidine synthase
MTVALLVGLGLGAGAVAWASGIRAAIGSAPDADVTAAALIAVGALIGTRFRGGPRSLGVALVGVGVVGGVVGAWSSPVGAALARVGGSLEGGAVGLAFARTIVTGTVLLPLGLLLGLAARRSGTALGAGRRGPGTLAMLALGAGTGALAANLLQLEGGPPELAHAGSAILVLVGAFLAVRPPARDDERDEASAPVSVGVAAAAVAFAVAAFSFLAPRPFRFAFGHELPGLPVAGVALAAGLALGALAAGAIAHWRPRIAGESATAAMLALAGAAAIAGITRLDRFPVAFLESIESVSELSGVVDAALQLLFVRVALLGGAIGAAATFLLVAVPDAARSAWAERTAAGAAFGALAGVAFARLALGPFSIPDTVAGAALVGATLAAGGALLRPRGRLVGGVAGIAGVALVAAVAARTPGHDSRMTLPERHFAAGRVGVEQRGWLTFEQDGANESVSVIRRGRSRRLLVDGRLEATNGLATRSAGVLVHLPLAVHPSPDRVLLLGIGNGAALAGAVAHPTEHIDCLARGPAFAAAAETFGDAVRNALGDGRVHLRFGDPEDLVARAGRYDVILHQASGAWTELSARLSKLEFLETARDLLEEDGLYGHWVPDDALTKSGLQSLLATVAAVFPQVEVWAGSGSAVIIVAKKTVAPHDFGNVLESWRDPTMQAAAADVWLEEPLSLVSHFLVSDQAVRRITRRAALHTRMHDELGRTEAARRRRTGPVNPVPGLFALGDDVLGCLSGTPEAGFAGAVVNAVRARALERAALEHEVERNGPRDTRALETWEAAQELNPRDRAIRRRLADLRSRMGIEYTNQQSVVAGYSNLRQAVDIDTTFAEGFANLGRHLAMSDEYDFAVAVTEHAVEMEPDNDLFALLLAQIWKRRTYYDKALPWYERAMELNPRNVAAAIGYVDTKLTMEENPDLEYGLEVSERYLELEPENEELRSRIDRLREAISDRDAPEEVPEPSGPDAESDSEPDSAEALPAEE